MDSIRDALLRMVKASRRIEEVRKTFVNVGLNDELLFESHGYIMDAVYALIGESVDEFENSVTYTLLTVPILSDERRAELLMAEYCKNHPDQPRPNTIERNDFKDMADKAGYYYETPEGDWHRTRPAQNIVDRQDRDELENKHLKKLLRYAADEMCARCGLKWESDPKYSGACKTCKWAKVHEGKIPE